MRLLPVGQGRLQVLDAAPHDPEGAKAVAAALGQLKPERLLVDRSVAEWQGDDPLGDILLKHGGGTRNVLWKQCTNVALLHADEPPKKGLKQLAKKLKKEGFEAQSPASAALRLERYYVREIPLLRDWREARRDAGARRIVANFKNGGRGVLVTTNAEAEELCERVRQLLS